MGGVLRLKAPEAPRGPIVKAQEIEAPRVKAPERKEMPADIYEWLKHLEECEHRRMTLAQKQVMDGYVTIAEAKRDEIKGFLPDLFGEEPTDPQMEPPTITSAKKSAEELRKDWVALNEFFDSKPPPERCKTVASQYGQALRETGTFITDIVGELGKAQEDPHAAIARLNEFLKTNKEMIDKPAMEADKGVQEICDEYDVRKWFTVRGDIAGGGMFAMPNVPMPGIGN